jgi:DtxR family Mn-dependent transcriptional regulator
MTVWKRFHEKEVTHSMAHYLQAIAALTHAGAQASVTAIADRLGVTRAGVTSMLRTLKNRDLVHHERYGDVSLTPEGRRLAARTERSRDVLTRFFIETLGLPPGTAEEDACMMEHLVSPATMVELVRLTAFLASGHPSAEHFNEVFREYQTRCASGEAGPGCPVCKGHCLKDSVEMMEITDEPAAAGS